MPPETPSSTRRPVSAEDPLASTCPTSAVRARSLRLRRPAGELVGDDPFGTLRLDLALGDLLEGDGERLVLQAGLDQRRDELGPALAELVVVRVDLSRAPGGEDHQRVLGVHLGQQVVDLRVDHGFAVPPVSVPDPRPPRSLVRITCRDPLPRSLSEIRRTLGTL